MSTPKYEPGEWEQVIAEKFSDTLSEAGSEVIESIAALEKSPAYAYSILMSSLLAAVRQTCATFGTPVDASLIAIVLRALTQDVEVEIVRVDEGGKPIRAH